MPATRTTKKSAKKTTKNTTKKAVKKSAAKPAGARMSLTETMRALEKAGSAQTRKTYARHGAVEPMFGVSFATLKIMVKRIGVDHALALELWDTGNHDARILAMKIADPARIKASDLDRWASENCMRACGGYVAMLAAESPHSTTKAREWLASSEVPLRAAGWTLVGFLANLDEKTPDEWFAKRLAQIEKSIHSAPNAEREAMNMALITIGGRNTAMRKAATAAAKRIGKVEVDHGDTACKTPDAGAYLEKMWAHAAAKKFESPAAQERARESMRTRC
jgi:3-methyladenine DNA glycosylase AlkD